MSIDVMTKRIYSPEFVLPSLASSAVAKRGMERVNLLDLGIVPGLAGGAKGINAAGDIITQTANAVPLNDLWNAYQEMLAAFNAQRDPVLQFLTWRTTKAREDLIGTSTLADFEEATEYGEPVGIRPDVPGTTSMGYMFKWYDLGARFTWMFLADADSSQVDAIANMAGEAYNRHVFTSALKTIFNTTRRTNKEGLTVYPFYAGAAGDLPPAVGTTTFADNHQHFTTAAALTPAALEAHLTLLNEHGYTKANGYSTVTMINKAQEGTVRNFRSTANGGSGTYDFIPGSATPALLLPVTLQVVNGAAAPATLNGIDVVGSYWETVVVKSDFIPAGYLVSFVTGGPDNIQNPVAIREHPQASLRGLRLVKGKTPDYPLIDSFYNMGYGTGVRYRGAGAVLQITGGAYTVPTAYVW